MKGAAPGLAVCAVVAIAATDMGWKPVLLVGFETLFLAALVMASIGLS